MGNISKTKQKICDKFTELVIENLEKGEIPWQKPWYSSESGFFCSFATKKPYRGTNAILLSLFSSIVSGTDSKYWATFNQIKKNKNYKLKKGSKGCHIVYYNVIQKVDEESGNIISFPIIKTSIVFNMAMVEGYDLEAEKNESTKDVTKAQAEFNKIQACEDVVSSYKDKPEIKYGGSTACYIPSKDEILMPEKKDFKDSESFYATLFHEMAHSTGHSKRLNRKEVVNIDSFGSHSYSLEELVAEFSSAFLCGYAGILNKVEQNSQAYIQSWARVLKKDPSLVFEASKRASKVFDYVMDIEKVVEKSEDEEDAA